MKVQIEKAVRDLDLLELINDIIDMSLNSETLRECLDLISFNINNRFISYGRAGSHIWVSIKDKRVLFITN